MSQVSFMDVRTGVMKALAAVFPDIDRYAEEIKEGLTPPCFFIGVLEPSHEQELGRRYTRDIPFDIHYFSETNKDRINMAEQLTSILETVQAGESQVRGMNISWQIVDEVLHFFITYRMQVWKQQPVYPAMQTLDVEEALKNG